LGSNPEYSEYASNNGFGFFEMPKNAYDYLEDIGDSGKKIIQKINDDYIDNAVLEGKEFLVKIGNNKLPGQGLINELHRLSSWDYDFKFLPR
jgi:hypothetical protein